MYANFSKKLQRGFPPQVFPAHIACAASFLDWVAPGSTATKWFGFEAEETSLSCLPQPEVVSHAPRTKNLGTRQTLSECLTAW